MGALEGSVIASALAWYVALAVVGVAGLVPAAVLFDRLSTRGVFLARPLGLAFSALLTWIAVAVTPVPYGTPAVIGSVAALLVASAGLLRWRREAITALRARLRPLLAAEVITAIVFVLVLLARMGAPDAWGTEKPADLMLLTAVHRAETFPPLDPWLAGERISYYHLGYVQMDHVARLAGESPERAFNLATATVGALAAAAVAGLAVDIVQLGGPRRRRTVLIAGGAALGGLLLVSPLVGLVQIAAANGLGGEDAWGWLGVADVPARAEATTFVPDQFWWWWQTTRVVPDVISEYPGFSLILGDPHPHLLALPLGLAALALAVQVFEGSTPLGWRRWTVRPDLLVLTAAVFAALVMTNAWDVITYGAVWAMAAWWSAMRTGWPALLTGFIAARWALAPAVVGLMLAWPFLVTLEPQPLGLAPVVGEYSDAGRWLLFWAPLLVPAAVGVALVWRPGRRRLLDAALVAALPVAGWAAWLLAEGGGGELSDRGWGWITLIALVAGVAWAGATLASEPLGRRAQGAGLFVVASALVILLLTEVVHIDDAFPGRLNTAFKFWFHAWTLMAVGGGALLALGSDRLIEGVRGNLRDGRRVHLLRVVPRVVPYLAGWAALLLAGATMLTPPVAAVARVREGQEYGLSAIEHLERSEPGFHRAVQWAQDELDPREDVVTEAISESYDAGSRFSAFTGVSTVLGWPGHERQWRSDIGEDARRAAVDAIYSGTLGNALQAVERWQVTHVLVSEQERRAYGVDVAQRFAEWPVAFSDSSVQVFEAPPRGEAR